MSSPKLVILLIGLLLRGDEASILNRVLDCWKPNKVYVILNSTTANDDMLSKLTYPRLVSALGDFTSFLPPNRIRSVFPDNFVLVLFTDDSCRNVVPILTYQLTQNFVIKRSKVLVVTKAVKEMSFIERMFRKLWQVGMLNVFVLADSSIFGFNPHASNFLIKYPATSSCTFITIDRAANFYGAPLRIPMIEVYPGAQNLSWHNRKVLVGEYHYIKQPLAEYFNATIRIIAPKVHDFGFEFFMNATTSVVHPGMGDELVQNRSALTIMPRVYSTSNYFDFLTPLYFRDCSLLIPKSGRIPQYSIVVSIASSWVGVVSTISLASIAVFTIILKYTLQIRLDITRFVFGLGSVFLGQSFNFPIKTLSMRFTVICWLITCISLGTLFNAEIVTSFLTPMFIKDTNNPFEAIQSGGDVYTFSDFVYYLKGNSKQLFPSEEMFQLLMKKLRGVSRDEFFHRVMHPNGRDMFLMMAMADNLIEKTKYLTEQTYSYHKTKPFFISLIANIVPRGSLIYNHYNDFSYRVFEAGLLQHWKTLELMYEIKFGSGNESQEKSLTVGDLSSAFLALGLGYALAVTIFLAELLHEELRTKFSK